MTLRQPFSGRCMADDALFHGGKSSADQGEGALLIFRPLAHLSYPAPQGRRSSGGPVAPQILAARPVPPIAETHLGELPC